MRSLFPFVVLLLCATACGTDAPPPADLRAQLSGRWDLAYATRSGKATESLDGTFFEFAGDQLTTNLSGAASTAAYDLDGMVIESTDPRLTQDYTIEKISGDSLVLQMEMRNFPFQFTLLKASEAQ